MERLSNKMLTTTEYFNIRAKRYAKSIQSLPNARCLDLLPYCYLFSRVLNQDTRDIKILDAFAGTGFLADSFSTVSKFLQVDASVGMLGNNCEYKKCTNDDFKDILAEIGENQFDYIFSHGGFHHVVDTDNDGNVLRNSSLTRQRDILHRLITMLKPSGYLVVADIPDREYDQTNSDISMHKIDIDYISKFIGDDKTKTIKDFLNISSGEEISLFEIQNRINEIIKNTRIHKDIPRYFFDEYISRKTLLGHTANYLNFKMIEEWISNVATKELQINFYSPWIFSCDEFADWFFKEKFSIGEESNIDECMAQNLSILNVLKSYLGLGHHNKYTYVNWGVTYAIYRKKDYNYEAY